MRIRITKANTKSPLMWYNEHVGEEFEVMLLPSISRNEEIEVTPDENGSMRFVQPGDYEIIVEPDPNRPFDPCEWGFRESGRVPDFITTWAKGYHRINYLAPTGGGEATVIIEYYDEMRERHVVYSGQWPRSASFGEQLLIHLGIIGGEK